MYVSQGLHHDNFGSSAAYQWDPLSQCLRSMLLQQKQEFLNKDRTSYDSQNIKARNQKGWIFLKNEESSANRLKVLPLPVPCQHFCLLKMTGMPLLCWRQQMAQCAFPQGAAGPCMWNVLWCSHPRQVSLQRQSKASYSESWSFSSEASFVWTQQINRPEVWLPTSTLLQINFRLFFFEETILLQA